MGDIRGYDMDIRFLITAVLFVAGIAPCAVAAETEDGVRCSALGSADFSQIPDAPTQVISAALAPASDDLPAHCAVQGYVTPNRR